MQFLMEKNENRKLIAWGLKSIELENWAINPINDKQSSVNYSQASFVTLKS